jgi:protein CpxP
MSPQQSPRTKEIMKRNLLTIVAVAGTVLAGFAIAEAVPQGDGDGNGGGRHHGWGHGGGIEHLTKELNLTPDQQAKVQPIIDQTAPQLKAIHQEAMQKAKGVIDNAMSQIRPLLTPEQQKKADDIRKAHEDMRNAMKEMHSAKDQ